MNTYLAIAYDCPDKEMINDIFKVEADNLRDATRLAWKIVPHAVAMDVDEDDDDE